MDLKAIFKDVPPETAKYGVVGWPLAHTLSPAMHNAAIKDLDLNAVYRAIPVPPEELSDFSRQAQELPLSGFNVTVPHKQKIAHALSPHFVHLGNTPLHVFFKSINTVFRRTNKDQQSHWVGGSTDGEGFLEDLKEKTIDVKNRNVILLGAGGAAAALLADMYRLGASPAQVVVLNRSGENAQSLKKRFDGMDAFMREQQGGVPFPVTVAALDYLPRYFSEAQILINAASVGSKAVSDKTPSPSPRGHPLPRGEGKSLESPSPLGRRWAGGPDEGEIEEHIFSFDLLHKNLTVYDLIYHRETELMKAARATGAKAFGGLGMLVHQGAKSFEIWFNRKPPIDVMRRAALDELNRRASS